MSYVEVAKAVKGEACMKTNNQNSNNLKRSFRDNWYWLCQEAIRRRGR